LELTVGTPIEFGGEISFQTPPEKLYALLTDLDAMTATIPDLVSAQKVDDSTIHCVVRPGFSFLRGTMKLSINVDRNDPPRHAVMTTAAQGIGVSMNVLANLEVQPDAGGSRLKWTAKVQDLKGLIAAVSPGLITAAANQVIGHTWSEVQKRLGGTA
jgi:2-furoyl-CoA dehydrogenase large subunit